MPKKKVEIIEPTVLNAKGKTKLNACAYARVSTDSEEQEGSFNNQKEYYEEKIKNLANHHFVGIFAEYIAPVEHPRPVKLNSSVA